MSREARDPAVRPYRTRWSVIAFVVIGLVVGLAIMLWQLSGDPPEEADSAPAPPRTAPLLPVAAPR